MYKYNINMYICVYRIYTKNFILLCYLIFYYTIFIPATYTGGGGSVLLVAVERAIIASLVPVVLHFDFWGKM